MKRTEHIHVRATPHTIRALNDAAKRNDLSQADMIAALLCRNCKRPDCALLADVITGDAAFYKATGECIAAGRKAPK